MHVKLVRGPMKELEQRRKEVRQKQDRLPTAIPQMQRTLPLRSTGPRPSMNRMPPPLSMTLPRGQRFSAPVQQRMPNQLNRSLQFRQRPPIVESSGNAASQDQAKLAREMQEMIEWGQGPGKMMLDGVVAVDQSSSSGSIYSIIGFDKRSANELVQRMNQIHLESGVCCIIYYI